MLCGNCNHIINIAICHECYDYQIDERKQMEKIIARLEATITEQQKTITTLKAERHDYQAKVENLIDETRQMVAHQKGAA